MKSTVSEKGQVTIPKPLRDRLGIRHGQVLDFKDEARKAKEEDPVRRVYGILKTRRSNEMIDALRGSVKK